MYDARIPIRMQVAQLTPLTKLWLLPDDVTLTEVVEKVTVDRLLQALLDALSNYKIHKL